MNKTASEKKPKFGMNVHTGVFNMNYMKIYVKLHLSNIIDDKDESVHGTVEKYVTAIEYAPKVFRYEDDKPAYEFDSIGEALDFCAAAGLNGYCASVILGATWNSPNIYRNYKKKETVDA